jgi:hypothetical protein
MLTAASYYQNKERLVEAHELLKKVGAPPPWGYVANKSRESDRCLYIIWQAVAMDPDSAAGHYKLGKCLQRMQRLPEAKVELHKALT